MKKVHIITTSRDYSILTLKDHLDFEIVDYQDLGLQGNTVLYKGKECNFKNVILRFPQFDNIKHNELILWHTVRNKKFDVLLDRDCFIRYPDYEDKLWQTEMFRNLGIPHPRTVFKPRDTTKLTFPVMVQKRIGTRCLSNYVLNNLDDLFRFRTDFVLDSIFQEYVKFQKDYRILVLNKSIIWVVRRDLILRGDYRRTAAFVAEKVPIDSLSKREIEVVNKIIDNWHADFIGIDMLITDKGPMVLEVNLFPQFVSKDVPDNNNTAEKLASFIKTRIV
jgi:hypothetical protein